jgi:hypothetical protein
VSTLRQSKLKVARAEKKLVKLDRVIERARRAALKTAAAQAHLNASEPFDDFMWEFGMMHAFSLASALFTRESL